MRGILFLIYVFTEVVITLPLAYAIGVLYTFLEVILSAILGVTILFNTPFKLQESFQKIVINRLSLSTFSLGSALRVLGAFLMILPGFFGDAIGVILLIWSTFLLVGNKFSQAPRKRETKDEDIIDVEIIDDNRSK